MRLIAWGCVGLVVCAVSWIALAPPGNSQERVTDEMLDEMFGRAHGMMTEQKEELHSIIDGFMMGDSQQLKLHAKRINRSIRTAVRGVPDDVATEDAKWRAVGDIVKQSKGLVETIEQGKHQEAYGHFSAMLNRCIECHQVFRSWGVFQEVKAEEPEVGAGDGDGTVQMKMMME